MVPWKVRKHFVSDFEPTQFIKGGARSRYEEQPGFPGFITALRTLLERFTPNWLIDPIKEDEIDPNDFELQEFYWVRRSTHRDGSSVPDTGFLWERLHYGEDIVFIRSTPYVKGVPQERQTEAKGYRKMLFIASLAERYLCVMRITDHLAGERLMERFVGTVTLSPQLFRALTKHPQYLGLREFWKQRGKVLRITPTHERYVYTVRLEPMLESEYVRPTTNGRR